MHRVMGAAALGVAGYAIVVACGGVAVAEDAAGSLAGPRAAAGGSVETVRFRQDSVKVLRGGIAPADRPVSRQIVSFGNQGADRVTVVRGISEPAPPAEPPPQRRAGLAPQPHKTIEQVEFAGVTGGVTVVRGTSAVRELFTADLFGPASAGELDRIAHAVHGAESSYGTDLRMWRPDPNGPQGPMQVSAAAALDVGGGNRFDLHENRLLGRAYLARMYRRYGNWRDALAAYNWGPGNVDRWIGAGRDTARLPAETVRYIDRVLRDALITTIAATRLQPR